MTDKRVDDHRYIRTDHLQADLKGKSIRGAGLTAVAQAARFAIQLGSTAILARLLSPEDFGLVAMTAVVIGLLGIFKDAGLSTATIQHHELTHHQVSTLFWINVAIGIGLALTIIAISPAIAAFYDEPRTAEIALALSLTFVFGGLTVQHQALLRRQMRFKALALVEIASAALGAIVGILLAYLGYGYSALVAIAVVTAIVYMLGTWLAVPWLPGLARRDSRVGSLIRFGTDILRFQLVNYFSRQADSMLIGWQWGAAPLGLYDKAYSLLMVPIRQINSPLAAVAVPALSRSALDESRFNRFFLRGLELMTSVTVPLVLVIAVFAEEVVYLWLGPDWMESASLFQLLAPAALVGALSNPVGWVLVSLGKTRRYRRIGFVVALITVSSFVIGLPYGAQGVAASYSIAMVVMYVPVWWFVVKGTPVRFREVMLSQLPSFAAALPAAFLALLIKLTGDEWLSAAVASTAALAAFTITYGFLLLVVFRKWSLLVSVAKSFRTGTA